MTKPTPDRCPLCDGPLRSDGRCAATGQLVTSADKASRRLPVGRENRPDLALVENRPDEEV